MNIALSLTVALLPAILLLLYIWKKDPQKEPTGQLVKAVLWGVAICMPIGFVELSYLYYERRNIKQIVQDVRPRVSKEVYQQLGDIPLVLRGTPLNIVR
jgi:RsiW-degrading membrane proteinase PrsW (M82 family)